MVGVSASFFENVAGIMSWHCSSSRGKCHMRFTRALHAINRPGFGSLYQASLVNGPAEPLVNALRGLARDIDAALQEVD